MTRKYHNKDWLYNQYVVKQKSFRELANTCGCAISVIAKWIHKFNVPVRHTDILAKQKEHADYMKAYHRKHPEKNRANVRRWRKAKPYGINRKPEKRQTSTKEWKEVIINFLSERDGWQCFHCREFLTLDTASIDHVISPFLGGKNIMDNLRLSCKRCNFTGGVAVRKQLHGY